MQVLGSLAPFAFGYIGWQLANSWLDRRQQQKAQAPPNFVEIPRKDEVGVFCPAVNLQDYSFVHNSRGIKTLFLKGAMTKPTAIMEELSVLGAKNVFIIAEDPESLALFTELGKGKLR